MKIAIIGSRNLIIAHLEDYIPKECTEIVSGGAKGIDACAAAYAQKNGLLLTEFFPDYRRYGKGAPLKRNRQIVDYADAVYAFWDQASHGTKSVIDYCKRTGKPCTVILIKT